MYLFIIISFRITPLIIMITVSIWPLGIYEGTFLLYCEYLCGHFQVGSASHSSRVNIYGLPYVRPMKKRPVVAGDTLTAHCPVAGYPIDSIVWERDGR